MNMNMTLEQWFASIPNKVNATKSCVSLNGFNFDFEANKPYYEQNSVALYLPASAEDWTKFHSIFLVTPGEDVAKAIDSGINCFKAAHKQSYDPSKCYIVLKQWEVETSAPAKTPSTELRKVGIVGTAGRDANPLLTKATWEAMYAHAESMVSPDIHLISGGAAWADHIAVKLFLNGKVGGLTLHLPAKFNIAVSKFEGAYKTAGHTAGYYHSKFKKAVGLDSLKELAEAIKKGAIVTNQEGTTPQNFFNRNTLIAKEAESLLAFTFDEEPKGGTGDTWKKFKLYHKDARAVNININQLVGNKTVTNTTVVPNTSTSATSTTHTAPTVNKEMSFEQILDIVSKDSEVISLMYSYLDKFERIAPDKVENISVQIYNDYIWLCDDKGSNSESCFKSYAESIEARTESAKTCFDNEQQDKAAYLASMQIEDTIIYKIIKLTGWKVTPAKYEHPFKTPPKANPATTSNPSELEKLKAQLAAAQKTSAKWQSKCQTEKTRADKLEEAVKELKRTLEGRTNTIEALKAELDKANQVIEETPKREVKSIEVDEVEQTVDKIINNPAALSKLAKAIKAVDNTNSMFDLSTVNETVTKDKPVTSVDVEVVNTQPKVIENCKLVTIYNGDDFVKQSLNGKDITTKKLFSGDGYKVYDDENGTDKFFVIQEQFYNDVKPLVEEQVEIGIQDGFTVTVYVYNKQDYIDLMDEEQLAQPTSNKGMIRRI